MNKLITSVYTKYQQKFSYIKLNMSLKLIAKLKNWPDIEKNYRTRDCWFLVILKWGIWK